MYTRIGVGIQSKKSNLFLSEFLILLCLKDVCGAQRRRQRGAGWVSDAEDPRPLHLVLTGHGSETVPPHHHFLFAVGLHTENSQGEEKGTPMLGDIRKGTFSRAHAGNKTMFPMSGTNREKKA